jgi:hypothetical protein
MWTEFSDPKREQFPAAFHTILFRFSVNYQDDSQPYVEYALK